MPSRSGEYVVRIGDGEFERLLAERPDDVLIADAFFADRLRDRAELVTATEANKTLGMVAALIERLRDRGVTRGDALVAVGGGIVQDVATGVASLYMRGLRWCYVPTTLLGMADSCIGGKSSLNVGSYKNLAGNFHPPDLVVVDPVFLPTLHDEDVAGGLCEAMKISFCRSPDAFARYLELHAAGDVPALLHHALAARSWFLEVDEFDQAERRLLNFGHTFGHALEAGGSFSVSHGIAVGIGVLCAERMAVAVDGEGAAQPALAEHALALVRRAPDLEARLAAVDPAKFERAFLADKKHGRDGLHLILPTPEGTVAERVLPNDQDTLRAAHAAVQEATRMAVAA